MEKQGIALTYIQLAKPQWVATVFLWTYNNLRPNMGIGGFTPAMKLKMAASVLRARPIETGGMPIDLRPGAGDPVGMQDVSADQILSRLPVRLKEARQRQGLSLDAVARLSGVSRSMVSQIERGESSPTVATLWNLTRALQVDFAGLLDAPKAPEIAVILADQAPRIAGHGKGCRITILSPPEQAGRLEVYDISLDGGGALDSEPHGLGTREQVTVIEGAVEIRAGADCRRLGPGDTAHYPADQPHRIAALSGAARVILIVQAQ